MKRLFSYLLPTLFLFKFGQIYGQCALPSCAVQPPYTIDISTGVYDSGQLIPVLSQDDDWKIKLPGSTIFQDVFCGSGLAVSSGNGWAYTTACCGYPALGNGLDPNVRWLAPNLDPITGNHIYEPVPYGLSVCPPNFQNCGIYYYRMYFDLSGVNTCNIQSASLNLQYIGGDNILQQININGNTPHAVNFGYNLGGYPFTQNPPSISIQLNELITNGQNYIEIKVENEGQYTGLIVHGNITFQTAAYVDFKLRDKDGLMKSEFCFGKEDVFLDGSGVLDGNYHIQISTVNGNIVTPVALQNGTGWAFGYPSWVNINQIFTSQNVPILSNQTYRVRLLKNTTCGPLFIEKDFKYICCESPPDPDFDLVTAAIGVTASSPISGTHLWTFYSTPKGNEGPYTRIGLFNTIENSISLNSESPCFYVEHKVTNACGTACTAMNVCNYACSDLECIVTKPSPAQYNGTTKVLSWGSVVNAQSYIIEIIMNDCPNCPLLAHPEVGVITIPVQTVQIGTINFTLNVTSFGGQDEVYNPCFRWKIYAVCADGTMSEPATGCSN